MNETHNRSAAAADFCWLRDAGRPLPTRILVLNLDDMSAALCDCSGRGEITQLWAVDAPGKSDFYAALSAHTGISPAACQQLCKVQFENEKRRYQRVMRGADGETVLLTLPDGGAVSFSDCETLLTPALSRLKVLLGKTDQMLAHSGMSPDTLRILPVGSLACFYPAEAALRLHFAGTVLIADSRFPEQRDGLWPDELVDRGQALYDNGSVEERPIFGHNVLLLLRAVSGENRDVELTLARHDTEADALLEGGTASPPFFVGENDALRLLVDGEQELLALPPKLWRKVIAVRLKKSAAGQCFLHVCNATDDEPGSLLPLRLCVNGKEKP